MSLGLGGFRRKSADAKQKFVGSHPLPRVFAVDLNDDDSERFQDSRYAGFSWYVFFTTLLVSLSALNIGWSIGMANISKPVICQLHPTTTLSSASNEFPSRLSFSENAWSISVGVLSVGGLIGALVSSVIADSIGRRNTLVINNGFFLAGSVLMGTSTTALHFTLGRFVMGVGCGVASGVATIYVGEIAPVRWRGFYGAFFQNFMVFGILVAQLASIYITTGLQWRIVVALPGVFSIVQIALLPLRVESPSYLIKARHVTEARHSLLKLRSGFDVSAEWQESLASLDSGEPGIRSSFVGPAKADQPDETNSSDATMKSRSPAQNMSKVSGCSSTASMQTRAASESGLGANISIWQMLCGRTRDDLRHLVICCTVLMALQQLSGISVTLFGGSDLSLAIFDPESPLSAPWACIVVCFTALPATLLCMLWVDKLGRRPMLLGSLGGMTICSVLISIGLFLGPSSMVMASVFLCYFLFNMGIGSIPWFLMAEYVPAYALGPTTVLSCSLNWILSLGLGLVVPVLEDAIPQWLFVIFGGLTFVGFFFVMLFVPETMDRTVSDVVAKHAGPMHIVIKYRRKAAVKKRSSGINGSLVSMQSKK
ncbi:Bifunctional purine biosynthesis protein PurH [Coemansia erecta]|uniref:Bifunctional purine biosynthesis protein PurH n=1 Tax=Coemansia asiatica TaxID=1052880 RepID=A0A9W7XRN1_9FUNG|nr:Bifunctional purine biosynthesis protein PurH [Coemansia asiatica]KAJ2855789.1 Bifunctional purine biosynthesis protein PurH [Coemansia erecta]KAJ2870952.1 Bifunctional purine biosynthesis protein PurH [Coemansia asiatica]